MLLSGCREKSKSDAAGCDIGCQNLAYAALQVLGASFAPIANDVAIVSLIEVWIGETERRTGFLAEIIHDIERPQTL